VADSKRQQILAALKTQLQKIKEVDGYKNTVKKVSYGYIPYSKVSEFPTICMIPLDAIFSPLTNTEYTSGADRNSLDGWPIAIISYVRNDAGEEELSDSREEIIEDVVKAMLSDRHQGLSSFVHSTYYISVAGTIDDKGTIATIDQIFSIKYDFDETAP